MRREVCTSVWIQASPAAVWHALTSFKDYGRWNPFIREVKGDLRVGELLSFKVAKGGDEDLDTQAKLLRVEPNKMLSWGGSAPLGLFRGVHSFTITSQDSGVIVENREVFSGPLAYLLIKKKRLVFQRKAFEMQDAALKRWLEKPVDVPVEEREEKN